MAFQYVRDPMLYVSSSPFRILENCSFTGHTLFHQPEAGLTLQLGNGALIAATTGIDTVCDFRRQDVSIGGQGAPLVPLGDALLFAEYDACLNLGGICNISMRKNDKRLAFDITFCNLVLNHLARRVGATYDDMGKISAEGQIIPELLHQMNTLNFVHAIPPRSTGREWVEEQVLPLFMHQYDPKDLLHTAVEHIAQQVAHHAKGMKVLVTGGGTYNNTLIHRMKHHGILPVVPSNELIDFKEALIFAFLGFLRAEGKKNTLSEVTGSHGNLCSGALYKGT